MICIVESWISQSTCSDYLVTRKYFFVHLGDGKRAVYKEGGKVGLDTSRSSVGGKETGMRLCDCMTRWITRKMTLFEFYHGIHLSCLVIVSFMLHFCNISHILYPLILGWTRMISDTTYNRTLTCFWNSRKMRVMLTLGMLGYEILDHGKRDLQIRLAEWITFSSTGMRDNIEDNLSAEIHENRWSFDRITRSAHSFDWCPRIFVVSTLSSFIFGRFAQRYFVGLLSQRCD